MKSTCVAALAVALTAPLLVGASCPDLVAAQEPAFEPALYRAGSLPILPTTAVGGGEVLLDAAVDAGGGVTSVTLLRETPPFGELFAEAVHGWTFRPGKDMGLPAPVHVLVAALVRPPALMIPSTHGGPARDLKAARAELPLPLTTVPPKQNPLAHRSGIVLVEVRIDASGRVTRAQVARSSPPFDAAAAEAAWLWNFRPARLRGGAVPAVAYIAFGFPEIVTGGSN
jgi:TonB family protein